MKNLLKRYGATHLLLDDPTNIFYLTGLHFSTARLLVSATKQILIIDSRYGEMAKKQFPKKVVVAKQLDETLAEQIPPNSKVAISSNHLHLDRYLSWKKFKQVKWIPCLNLLAPLRMIKSKGEIAKIKAACKITCDGYAHLLKQLKPGVTEKELSQKLQIFFLEQGAENAFPPIIAFGPHSAVPHHSPTDRAYKKGEIVQFDIGSKKDEYCSDFSRVYSVPTKLKPIEAIVQQAKEAAERVAKPGATMGDVDRAAREVIAKAGYEKQFLHSIGHGVGLDIHETPLVKLDGKEPLQEGMVITIEPGIYIEGVGGIRLEDTYLITKKGAQNLDA